MITHKLKDHLLFCSANMTPMVLLLLCGKIHILFVYWLIQMTYEVRERQCLKKQISPYMSRGQNSNEQQWTHGGGNWVSRPRGFSKARLDVHITGVVFAACVNHETCLKHDFITALSPIKFSQCIFVQVIAKGSICVLFYTEKGRVVSVEMWPLTACNSYLDSTLIMVTAT